MKFKKGDTVQFIEKNQLLTGQITDINVFTKDNFNYSVDVNVGSDIVSFRMIEDELALAKILPIIPKFVADNIECDKRGDKDIYESLEGFYTCGSLEMKEWLIDNYNYETYCRAWLDGYEIEKEPLYYVKLMVDDTAYLNLVEGTDKYFLGNNSEFVCYKTKFTEQEIKEMDERFWAFAVPVEDVEEDTNEI